MNKLRIFSLHNHVWLWVWYHCKLSYCLIKRQNMDSSIHKGSYVSRFPDYPWHYLIGDSFVLWTYWSNQYGLMLESSDSTMFYDHFWWNWLKQEYIYIYPIQEILCWILLVFNVCVRCYCLGRRNGLLRPSPCIESIFLFN